MTDIPINSLDIGAHVWRSWSDLKTKDSGLGTITAAERPYYTMDFLLYTVRWANGEESKHYFKDLFCVNPFDTAQEFLDAIIAASELKLTVGPKGGFRSFRCTVDIQGEPKLIRISGEHGRLFRDLIDPYLKKKKVKYETQILEARKPQPRVDVDELYGRKPPRK